MSDSPNVVPTWKVVLAAILDFSTAFFVGGLVIGWATGNLTQDGFKLNGAPALLLFTLIVVYFVAGKRAFGGTVSKRILGIPA
jgi:uncharacterized RDD family membrane protein YckC